MADNIPGAWFIVYEIDPAGWWKRPRAANAIIHQHPVSWLIETREYQRLIMSNERYRLLWWQQLESGALKEREMKAFSIHKPNIPYNVLPPRDFW